MNKDELYKIIESEGAYYEWTNTLKCFIQRNHSDAWCGYVTIPKSFPIDFDQEINLNCHGGVTYQSIQDNGDLIVGFDCAHYGDLVPKYLEIFDFKESDSVYRDKKFVIDEVNSMVKQILEVVEVHRHLRINQILKSE